MYLQKSKNSAGKVYLSFVQGYRQNGKVKHKTVEKLGYLEDLEKIYDDPISHFKAIAEERNAAAAATEKKLEVNLSEIIAQDSSLRKNVGYAAFYPFRVQPQQYIQYAYLQPLPFSLVNKACFRDKGHLL